eukprot:jgi/Botrbrau1/9558/Bobra.0089s0017.2
MLWIHPDDRVAYMYNNQELILFTLGHAHYYFFKRVLLARRASFSPGLWRYVKVA